MSGNKRAASETLSGGVVAKRPRSDVNTTRDANGAVIKAGPGSSALDAPVMELTGHTGEVFATRFNPSGDLIASGSMDRSIMLWYAAGGCQNYRVLSGHKGAVLDLHWSKHGPVLYSASADATVCSWDTETGQRIRRHQGHDSVINTLDVSKRGIDMLVSGSDDGSVSLWDTRAKEAVDYFDTEQPVTAVALSETGSELYQGGLDNDIKVWDMRKKAIVFTMKGHTDTVTSLQVSPDSSYLLSNSHDSTVRTWDIRPFAPENRHVRTYDGAPTGVDKNLLKASWDATGQRIAAGGGDRTAVVWETRSGKMLSKLPGHRGAVNDVRFSPDGSLLLSGSTDQRIMLGELGK